MLLKALIYSISYGKEFIPTKLESNGDYDDIGTKSIFKTDTKLSIGLWMSAEATEPPANMAPRRYGNYKKQTT